MKSSKKKKIILIIISSILLLLLLLWGFAVPHYSCKQCDFQFWGKYYSKNTCNEKCKSSPSSSPLSVSSPLLSDNKRHFCANVSHTNTNGELHTYKICAPCKDHHDYVHGIKYGVDSNGNITHDPCTELNSHPNKQACNLCLEPNYRNSSQCTTKNDNSCNLVTPYTQVVNYVNDIQPLILFKSLL